MSSQIVSVLEHTVRSLKYGQESPKIRVPRLTCDISVNRLRKVLSLRKLHLYLEDHKACKGGRQS